MPAARHAYTLVARRRARSPRSCILLGPGFVRPLFSSVFYGVVGGVFTLDPGQGPYFPTLAKFVEFYTEYEGINPKGDVKLLGPAPCTLALHPSIAP